MEKVIIPCLSSVNIEYTYMYEKNYKCLFGINYCETDKKCLRSKVTKKYSREIFYNISIFHEIKFNDTILKIIFL